jgi:homoaconitase/3-isopropylmalate dehydratase large subunit
MSNMGVEIGAKFAIFEADDKTFEFLKGRARYPYNPVESDPDAVYERRIEVDVSALEPQVACPHDVGNVKSVTELERENVRIHQGFIGSCTNARQEDLEVAARILDGVKVHPEVRLIVSPASMEIWRDAVKAGWLETFADAEALVCHPTCGPCYGGHMGLLAAGERAISASNRNFQGRMGSPQSEVYLASAATVAASCIAGHIVDPRKYV